MEDGRQPEVAAVDAITGPCNDLAARWSADLFDGRTLALSAPALWPLLAALAAGADGDVRDRLAAAIGADATGAGEQAGRLMDLLNSSPVVRAAFSVWSRPELVLDPCWLDGLPAHSHGLLTGRPEDDRGRIDAWVRERTGGVIDALPTEPRADTLLLLISTMFLQTRWRDPFEVATLAPVDGPWAGQRRLAGLRANLSDPTALSTVDGSGGALTRLVLAGTDDVDVHLVLGAPEATPAGVVCDAIAALDAGGRPAGAPAAGVTVVRARSAENRPQTHVTVPEFAVQVAHDLLRRSALLGLPDRAAPPTSRMAVPALAIDDLAQYLAVRFDQNGFTAAVVAAERWISVGRPRTPYEVTITQVTFDRPYAFLAVHRPSRLVLVAGWVARPRGWID